MFTTYIHRQATTGKVFYVGMGSYHRMTNKSMRSKEWHEMAKDGRTFEIVANWDTKQEAYDHEKLLIACFRDMGHPIINKTSGGAGNDAIRSDELRQCFSQKMRGNNYRLGHLHDENTKHKMSLARKNIKKQSIMCLECGKIVGGHSNINSHQKSTNHFGKTVL
jgi:hypothetical protein